MELSLSATGGVRGFVVREQCLEFVGRLQRHPTSATSAGNTSGTDSVACFKEWEHEV